MSQVLTFDLFIQGKEFTCMNPFVYGYKSAIFKLIDFGNYFLDVKCVMLDDEVIHKKELIKLIGKNHFYLGELCLNFSDFKLCDNV